jgi:hypothetical protein
MQHECWEKWIPGSLAQRKIEINFVAGSRPGMTANEPGHDGKRAAYFLTYFCTRQFSVSATKISSRGLTAM